MSDVIELRTAVTVFYGGSSSRLLQGLTNLEADNSDTSINDTVLDAHCEHVISRFRLETGVAYDTDNLAHKNICILGVRASIEAAKGRDGSLMRETETRFRNMLITFRKKMRGSMKSSSRIQPSTEPLNSLPDSDRTQIAFSNTKRSGSNNLRELNN